MGSYDGAELCKLIRIFTQLVLQDVINKDAMGLYRDFEITKKTIHVFKDNGFSNDMVINLMEVNFLNVTFNLRKRSYQPYKKPNDELKDINVLSNHPPQILKQLNTTINDRLSRNS